MRLTAFRSWLILCDRLLERSAKAILYLTLIFLMLITPTTSFFSFPVNLQLIALSRPSLATTNRNLGSSFTSDLSAGNLLSPVSAASNLNPTFGYPSSGSTSYPRAKTVTATHGSGGSGTPIIDTNQSVFGGASGKFVAADKQYLSLLDSPDWVLGGGRGDFTIDFRVRFASLPANSASMYILEQYQDANNQWYIGIHNAITSYSWYFVQYPNSSTRNIDFHVTTPSISINTWYHVALVRSGKSFYFFQDGVQVGSTYTRSASILNFNAPLWVGTGSISSDLNGWLDELRVSNGVARWTGKLEGVSGFTLPTTRYDCDSYTVLLLHMDLVTRESNESTVFLDDVTTGRALATKFTLSQNNAAPSSISVYSHAVGNMRVAIFTDNGAPSAKICETADTAVTASQWTTITISGCGVLSAGSYWLVEQWNPGSSYTAGPSYTLGSANAGDSIFQPYASFPAVWAGGILSTEEYSIYVTYGYGTGGVTLCGTMGSSITIANATVTLSATISSSTGGIEGYKFAWNNTGIWLNQTATPVSPAANVTATFTGTWNSVVGKVISAKMYANDSLGAGWVSTTSSFTLTGYSIQSSAGYGGTISASTILPYHGSVTFTMNPKSGFAIGNVIVDGVYVGKPSSYAFTAVTSSHTISVAFQDQTGNLYSIIQITDTQYLSETYPTLFTDMTDWIVNNTGTFNVRMVIHTGDIVEHCNSTTEWQNANTSMAVLLNNNVPYTWDAGNHDQFCTSEGFGDPNRGWIGVNYVAFNAAQMETKPYWVSDLEEGKDTAVKFSYGGRNFLIINMEFEANATVISWMRNLINAYPTYNVIVAVHEYLTPSGAYAGNWATSLQTTLRFYPNAFLTLNGHLWGQYPSAWHDTVGNRVETMFNLQEYDNQQGAATVRIFTFNTTSDTVSVSAYSVYNNLWLTDSGYSFSFSAHLDHAITLPARAGVPIWLLPGRRLRNGNADSAARLLD